MFLQCTTNCIIISLFTPATVEAYFGNNSKSKIKKNAIYLEWKQKTLSLRIKLYNKTAFLTASFYIFFKIVVLKTTPTVRFPYTLVRLAIGCFFYYLLPNFGFLWCMTYSSFSVAYNVRRLSYANFEALSLCASFFTNSLRFSLHEIFSDMSCKNIYA